MNKKLQFIFYGTYIITAATALLSLLVPTPSAATGLYFHTSFIAAIFMAFPHLGAVAILLLGLRGFTIQFKKAYLALVVGFILLAVSFLQTPFLSWFGWLDSPWVTYGLVAMPFLAAIILIYLGIRRFALLSGIKNVFTSIPLGTIAALAIGALCTFIPHGRTHLPDIQVKATIFTEITLLAYGMWSGILGYQVKQRVGQLYIPAMSWLSRYLIGVNIVTFTFLTAYFIKPTENPAIDSGAILAAYLIATFALMRAGFAFNKISSPEPEAAVNAITQAQDLSGVIIYTAGLASSPAAIDPILDEMRMLTSVHQAGAPLTDGDQITLAEVYLRLEAYLAEQEPIRKFSKEELRSRVQRTFANVLERNNTFWKRIIG